MAKIAEFELKKKLTKMCKECSGKKECESETESLKDIAVLGIACASVGVGTIGGAVAVASATNSLLMGALGGLCGASIGKSLTMPITDFVGNKTVERRQKACAKELGIIEK